MTDSHPNLGPDYSQAEQFLQWLAPNAAYITFQTFDDNKARKDPGLTRIFHAPFDKVKTVLAELNAQGAGVFYSVNATDGKGRKASNITGIRAIWQDDDDGFQGNYPLAPSVTIQTSPNKFQRLWLVKGDMTPTQHKDLMSVMVRDYGADNNARDIARLLRLPGFYHMKTQTPFLVHIVEGE